MAATVAATGDERKHTFDSALDIERAFEHDGPMERTYVRRRRTLAAVASLVLLLTIGSPVARAFGGTDAPDVPAATYVVKAGDTLWSIAEGHAPGEDPRVVVHQIAELNDLDGGPLVPGRALVLPDAG
jgi:nucleoid-associated protein YgaU